MAEFASDIPPFQFQCLDPRNVLPFLTFAFVTFFNHCFDRFLLIPLLTCPKIYFLLRLQVPYFGISCPHPHAHNIFSLLCNSGLKCNLFPLRDS